MDRLRNFPIRSWEAERFVTGGSCFRGELLARLASSQGVEKRPVIQAAVAVELLHNASLVHDDLMDEDRMRRGRLSSYGALGHDKSLLLGDALIAETFAILAEMETDPEIRCRAVSLTAQTISIASIGQAEQASRSINQPCSLEDCLAWSRQKTGALIALPVELACILANDEDSRQSAHSAALQLGLAYQIKDDLLDWLGLKKGRSGSSDYRNKQWTVPLVFGESGESDIREKCLDLIEQAKTDFGASLNQMPPEYHGILNTAAKALLQMPSAFHQTQAI